MCGLVEGVVRSPQDPWKRAAATWAKKEGPGTGRPEEHRGDPPTTEVQEAFPEEVVSGSKGSKEVGASEEQGREASPACAKGGAEGSSVGGWVGFVLRVVGAIQGLSRG